jgi:hypothetical protein
MRSKPASALRPQKKVRALIGGIGKENPVKSKVKFYVMGLTLACAGLALVGMLISPSRGRADDQRDDSDSRIRIGFEIAPVHLNLDGKNPALVGLGSYIVNTEGCNDCHSAGPRTEYAMGGNPFFGQPKKVNQGTYLGGGRDFGELAVPPVGSAHIISRNLTPTPKTGLPGGDITYEKFLQIIRHGTDFDTTIHPTCTGAPNVGCIPKPFDGSLLQVMPWPNFKDLTDHETRAVYEYLKAVPCIQGNYPGPGGADANIPPEPADRCSE